MPLTLLCRQLVVLTGAGCSTESSVPDYRGPQGAYSTGFKPITHQQVDIPATHAMFDSPVALLLGLSSRPACRDTYLGQVAWCCHIRACWRLARSYLTHMFDLFTCLTHIVRQAASVSM